MDVKISVNDSIASATRAKEFPNIPAVPLITTKIKLAIIPIKVVLLPMLPASAAEYILVMINLFKIKSKVKSQNSKVNKKN